MGETRGRKGKKSKWQITLGLKELIFAGIGLAGLIMLSFALGTLAGRGDIYRVLHNWGLLGPEAGNVIQAWPAASNVSAPPVTPAPAALPQEAAPPVAVSQPPAPVSPPPVAVAPPQAAAPPHSSPAPVTGAMAPPSPPTQVRKKPGKGEQAGKDPLEKLRREVAPRLKFQNSLDPAAKKPGRTPETTAKGSDKSDRQASPRSTQNQIFVAKYRDGNQAKTQLARLRQKGERVTLKEGKDSEGHFYALYRELPAGTASPPSADKGQKPRTSNKSSKSTP